MSVEMMQCKLCPRQEQPKYKRVVCEKHSPFGYAHFTDYKANPSWLEQSKCYIGFSPDEGEWCPGVVGVNGECVWPNGGFICSDCLQAALDRRLDKGR